MEIRIGHGIDIHQFETGRRCILGGVNIPYERGLKGHSDADALLHAIVDALLGATGRPDIGTLFPDNDPIWKDAGSHFFLQGVWSEMKEQGWTIQNIDCTIIAEEPKLKPHIDAMKKRIGEILSLSTDCIGIKATTSEKLGALGRGEGLLASAVVLLIRE